MTPIAPRVPESRLDWSERRHDRPPCRRVVILGAFGGDGSVDLRGFALGIAVSAALHVFYMLVLQRGYAVGNLSTVYATARGSGPLLTVIVAVAVLGERPSPIALVGIAAILVGVIGIGFVDRNGGAAQARRGVDPAIVFGLLTGAAIAAYTLWDAHALRAWHISPGARLAASAVVVAGIALLAM
ncbi:hypothetical protein [Microbacterium jejuense]|uniref:hypothetical protein n=1 Tax=Microbacterium jejuense TaxID=1263637 RepID=UPI0031EBDABB